MSAPRWIASLLRRLAPDDRAEDLLGDLEELHRERVRSRSRWMAVVLTSLEALDMALALVLHRIRRQETVRRSPVRRGVAGLLAKSPPISWLDVKLGIRMLVKYPGLTLVGGLAMAFGIWVGVGGFEFYSQVVHPHIPLDEGDRIVGITLVDATTGRNEYRLLHDLGMWCNDLSSVVDLGAASPVQTNLVVSEARGEPVEASLITASAFRLARVPPLMGRTLVAEDERPGSPAVAVIGYDLWQTRFGSDLDVVGRTVRVGDDLATVVGVMPEGFAFPVNQRLWLPLRVDPAGLQAKEGPGVRVFGRLAPGATLQQAQAELDALVRRAATQRPDVYEHLKPQVLPWAHSVIGVPRELLYTLGSINILLGLLLMLVCGNVALLVFARAAAREEEIAVRTALGASRSRVVGQLFVEALVLGTVSGVVGLSAAGLGLRWLFDTILREILDAARPPFWAHSTLSPSTVVYAVFLTLLAAFVAGAVPGLRITNGKTEARLKQATAGGGGLRFGGVWSAVIVVQVALTVTFPAAAWMVRREAVRIRAHDVGFAAREVLTAQLRLAPLPGGESREAYFDRLRGDARSLFQRLGGEAGVTGVAYGSGLPGTYHSWRRIEMDAGGETPRDELDLKGPGRRVAGAVVSAGYFQALGVDVLQGRGFNADDSDPEVRTVVVNRSFVTRVLGDRNPIGRRLRYLGSDDGWDGVKLGDEPGPWYRIVGVVPDLGMSNGAAPPSIIGAGIYHAVLPGDPRAGRIFVPFHGDAGEVMGRLRRIASDVDPDLGLDALQTADHAKDTALSFYSFWIGLITGVSAVALLLSLAGIYAVLSFTVARRTREIGVRVALGARPWRVVSVIFARPLLQTGGGILGGIVLVGVLNGSVSTEGFWGRPLLMLTGYGALMAAVCVSACIVPTRRALSVEPSEALRAE